MPSSGRWMALFAGEFRRLRAASYFARGGKVTKTPPGTAPDEHFVLIVAFPRTPFTGVIPWGGQNISGAQNQECVPELPPGHWALGLWKIRVSAVPFLRLALPNQRSRAAFRRRGDPRGRPKACPLPGGMWPKGPDEGDFLMCTHWREAQGPPLPEMGKHS